MSKKLNRFDPDIQYIGSGDYLPKMTKEDDGDYVEFTDHEAAVRELAEQLEEARGIILQLNEVCVGNKGVLSGAFYDRVAVNARSFLLRTKPTDPSTPTT